MDSNVNPHPRPEASSAQSPQGAAKAPKPGEAGEPAEHPLEQILKAARDGNKKVLPNLQTLFNQYPEIWQTHGDLARMSEEAWIDAIYGNNLLAGQACRRVAEQMKVELAGPDASPMDRLLAETLVADWLALKHAHIGGAAGANSDGPAVGKLRVQRMESAARRLTGTAKTLATVRRLAGGVKIELTHVNAPTAPTPPVAAEKGPEQARDEASQDQPKRTPVEAAGPAQRVRELLREIEPAVSQEQLSAST